MYTQKRKRKVVEKKCKTCFENVNLLKKKTNTSSWCGRPNSSLSRCVVLNLRVARRFLFCSVSSLFVVLHPATVAKATLQTLQCFFFPSSSFNSYCIELITTVTTCFLPAQPPSSWPTIVYCLLQDQSSFGNLLRPPFLFFLRFPSSDFLQLTELSVNPTLSFSPPFIFSFFPTTSPIQGPLFPPTRPSRSIFLIRKHSKGYLKVPLSFFLIYCFSIYHSDIIWRKIMVVTLFNQDS